MGADLHSRLSKNRSKGTTTDETKNWTLRLDASVLCNTVDTKEGQSVELADNVLTLTVGNKTVEVSLNRFDVQRVEKAINDGKIVQPCYEKTHTERFGLQDSLAERLFLSGERD